MHQWAQSWHWPRTSGFKNANSTVTTSSATQHLLGTLFLDESAKICYYNHLAFSQNFRNKLGTWFSHPQSSIIILFCLFIFFQRLPGDLKGCLLKLDLNNSWGEKKMSRCWKWGTISFSARFYFCCCNSQKISSPLVPVILEHCIGTKGWVFQGFLFLL